MFPRAVTGFVGREPELARALAHLSDAPVHLVYGVGGVGKSELVFELVRRLREHPEWADAAPVHLAIGAGASPTRVLADLLAALGAAPEPRRGQPTVAAHLEEQVEALARGLEASAHLVFVDDAHHLPAAPVAAALAYLSRHVRRSRVFVASRVRFELDPKAPPPVVTTLGPLAPEAAEALASALAERTQRPRPSLARVMRRTHGSPFHIRRLVAGADLDAPEDVAWAEVPSEARRVLLAVATLSHRPSLEALRVAFRGELAIVPALRALTKRFLLDEDGERAFVHDLVGEPLLASATRAELAAARRDAAALCLEERGREADLRALDAIAHLLAAGRPEEAWAVVGRACSALAAAGHDHLLLGPLERLGEALPARRVEIDLLRARCLVRASLIEDADRVLATIEPVGEAEARHLALAGEIAQRRGQLARAARCFERALALATDGDGRFSMRLQIASVAALRTEGERARAVLDAALDDLEAPSPPQRARCAWVRTTSWMFQERYERAASEARAAVEALEGSGLDDLVGRLAMLETLAAIEAEDMAHARAAGRRIRAEGLRGRVASFYRALLRLAEGDTRRAAEDLATAHEALAAQGDLLNAYLAGHYGSVALSALGRLAEARSLGARARAIAGEAGLDGVVAMALAQEALLAAESMMIGEARRLADEALAIPRIGPRSTAVAHRAHARAAVVAGDHEAAIASIGRARAALDAPDLAAARMSVDLELAAVHLVGGDLDETIALAERVVAHYRERLTDAEAARALLVLAAGYVARGRPADLLLAGESIARCRAVADRGELRQIQVGCAILEAARARRDLDPSGARARLAAAVVEHDPERGSLYASALLAAIDGGVVAWALPGVTALLSHLGFTEPIERYLVDRRGRRAATRAEVQVVAGSRELFVDEVASVIRAGGEEVRGRPMQSALLGELIRAPSDGVPPDLLYERVWNVGEYHPLHHRNALYVALNRLRRTLAEALPERDVVVRASRGWRIADDVDACVAAAVRAGPRPAEGPAL